MMWGIPFALAGLGAFFSVAALLSRRMNFLARIICLILAMLFLVGVFVV